MERSLDAVRRHTQGGLTIEGMRAVYRAAIRWANVVGTGAPDIGRELCDFNFCHELGRRVDASNRVWWTWTEFWQGVVDRDDL